MTDILTEEDLKNMKASGNSDTFMLWNVAVPSLSYFQDKAQALQSENQTLQAQVNGLREALENMEAAFSSMHYDSHDVKKCPYDYCQKCDGFQTIMQAREALEVWKGRQ